ncbi:MAG: hypothetical protein KDE26_18000 [Bacteroidetes bacterium]|nr:hypothetical protein [Bacteroidota bacterium]MCB0845150.1 hypothetical protein [Bacteroidota bacterium]
MARIKEKKIPYPVDEGLSDYLKNYGRDMNLPILYEDLMRYSEGITLYDKYGKDTDWISLMYSQDDLNHINESLKEIYAILRANGDLSVMRHLYIDRIDLCLYGNTNPFRVRIVNNINDNFDYFYIKKADASRVYGLELEHLLSPNRISFVVDRDTLIEEHIAGVPGEDFFRHYLNEGIVENEIRLAKEFVKFNERCFVRLLGDMHSSNYVVEIMPDFEDIHYRLRAIDFDQQSYEPRKSIYMPKYFKENMPIIEVGLRNMTPTTVRQYQKEERSMIASRFRYSGNQIKDLLNAMANSQLSKPRYVKMLAKDLSHHYRNNHFLSCRSMGEIVTLSLQILIDHN